MFWLLWPTPAAQKKRECIKNGCFHKSIGFHRVNLTGFGLKLTMCMGILSSSGDERAEVWGYNLMLWLCLIMHYLLIFHRGIFFHLRCGGIQHSGRRRMQAYSPLWLNLYLVLVIYDFSPRLFVSLVFTSARSLVPVLHFYLNLFYSLINFFHCQSHDFFFLFLFFLFFFSNRSEITLYGSYGAIYK